jgi:hypothetical protein
LCYTHKQLKKMKRVINIYTIITSLLLFTLASCAVTEVDRGADFNRYKTFSWGNVELKTDNPLYKGDLINRKIKATIADEFAKRGITYNDANPDFLVSYQTYTEQKQQTFNNYYSPFMPYGYGFFPYGLYPFGFGGWGYPYGYGPNGRTYTYTEGTLIIDITDKKTNDVVWRGSVTGNIQNASNVQKQIRKGIKAILKKYPVPANDVLQLEKKNAIS